MFVSFGEVFEDVRYKRAGLFTWRILFGDAANQAPKYSV